MKRSHDEALSSTEAVNAVPDESNDDETAWKDDDFLAFDTPAKNDPTLDEPQEQQDDDEGNDEYDSMDESSESSQVDDAEKSITFTPPWVLMKKIHRHKNIHPLVHLHNEILQFVHLMEPLESERRQRERLIQDLHDVVAEEFGPTAQLLVLG